VFELASIAFEAGVLRQNHFRFCCRPVKIRDTDYQKIFVCLLFASHATP
jgi:hypothetical protein